MGHIHIGYDNPDLETTERIIKAFDVFLGLPSVWLDKDINRKKMYGKAGSFRMKSYGCEARVLSNFWIHDNRLIEFVYNNTALAVNIVLNDSKIFKDFLKENEDNIQEAINENNIELAKKLYKNIKEKIKTKSKIKV